VADNTPLTVRLRQLVTEVAKVMQAQYTFQEIAEKFYEAGVIDSPKNPYPEYPGTKRDYVHEMLSNASNLETFLRTTLPGIVVEIEVDEGPRPDTRQLIFLMQKLGYQLDPEDAMAYASDSYVAPPSFPSEVLSMSGAPQKAQARTPTGTVPGIQIPDLPGAVQELVEELNDNLERGNKNAAALLTRKILHQAVFIAMKRRQKEHLLKTETGDDVGLEVAVAKCSQEYGVSRQVVGRATSAKWIGDSANHSYRVKVNEGDLHSAVTGLRLYLEEIL
jgi:hypothetical protein